MLPAALSGIVAAFIIGISRAIGETMIVALAAGSGPNFTFNPFKAAETMTGYIARISGGDLATTPRLQQHLRHRSAAVPGHPGLNIVSRVVAPLPRGVRMSTSHHSPFSAKIRQTS